MSSPGVESTTLAELARAIARLETQQRDMRAELTAALETRARDTVPMAVWQAEKSALADAIAREISARQQALTAEATSRVSAVADLRAVVDEERRGRQSGQRMLVGAVVAAILGILAQYVQLGLPT